MEALRTYTNMTANHATRLRVIAGMVSLSFMSVLDQLIITPAMPRLGVVFGNTERLPWIVTAYFLASAISIPIYGRLSDTFGRRKLILISIALFALGSLLCALAPTLLSLVFARGLQGAGAGGLVPLAQTAIADVVPPHERGKYQSYFIVSYVLASFSGPLLGGVAVQYFTWRLMFIVNIPICVLSVIVCDRGLRGIANRGHGEPFDYIGAILISTAALALMLALSKIRSQHLLLSWWPLPLFGLAAVLIARYIAYARTASTPLVPIRVLRNKIVICVVIGAFFLDAAFVGLEVYTPSYFQIVMGEAPTTSGLALGVMSIGAVVSAACYGPIAGHYPWTKWLLVLGLALSVVSIVALALFTGKVSTPRVFAILAILALGFGMVYPSINIALQNAIPHRDVGVTTATSYFLRTIGSSSSTAILGGIFLRGVDPKEGIFDPGMAPTFATMLTVIAFFTALCATAFAVMPYKPLRKTIEE
jgi:EmrB/QacA subfamily drug resistance transporter